MAAQFLSIKFHELGTIFMENLVRLMVAAGAATALSACGGGGGGGTGAIPFTSNSALPTNGTVVVNGSAVTARYSVSPTTGDATISSVSGPNSASATTTFVGGDRQTIDIRAPGASVTLNDVTDGSFGLPGARVGVVSSDLDGGAIFENVAGYEYQTYGIWFTGVSSTSGVVGAGSFGAPTQASSMPIGNAVYNGTGVGFARDSAGRGYYTDFDVTADTNFTTINVSSSNTFTEDIDSGVVAPKSDFDFSGSGSVSGANFTASITSTATSGTATGSFYGPSAEEFGGTFETTGTGGAIHIGSFGGQ
ncbi:MAG: transferrin-binding protein-like solute binding protein [Pseudomonadota bacterium]